jgi:hypothetical protein
MANPKPDAEPLFLTAEAICARYSLTLATLKRWTNTFAGPAHIAISPRIIRYDLAAFDAWFRSHAVGEPASGLPVGYAGNADAAALKKEAAIADA